jgi:hypothetical protein
VAVVGMAMSPVPMAAITRSGTRVPAALQIGWLLVLLLMPCSSGVLIDVCVRIDSATVH